MHSTNEAPSKWAHARVCVCVPTRTRVHTLKSAAKPKQSMLATLQLGHDIQKQPIQRLALGMEGPVREKGGERWERTYVQK